MLWRVGEPWPTCGAKRCSDRDGVRYPADDGESPLVPVLQLFARDVPQLPFPDRTDVMQLLWCPFDHDESEPWPVLFWRAEADLTEPDVPGPHPEAEPTSIPAPCTVSPEAVDEYTVSDLPDDVYAAAFRDGDAFKERTGWDLNELAMAAPGTKVLGWPNWVQGPDWPACAGCGTTMSHLITITSWEHDGWFSRRWTPLEDQPAIDFQDGSAGRRHPEIHNPHGLMLGDVGNYHVFECLGCPDRPYDHRWACS
jgi:hypothetical protein